MVSATFELMSSSLSKGFKSKKPQKPIICRVFFNCLRMRRWSGRRLDSWNGMRKRLWFSTFKAALSTPTRFQTLWSLRTKLKSKSSSCLVGILCVLVRGQWPRKHLGSLSMSHFALLCIHLLQETNSTVSAPKVTIKILSQKTQDSGLTTNYALLRSALLPALCGAATLVWTPETSWKCFGCCWADFGPQVFRPHQGVSPSWISWQLHAIADASHLQDLPQTGSNFFIARHELRSCPTATYVVVCSIDVGGKVILFDINLSTYTYRPQKIYVYIYIKKIETDSKKGTCLNKTVYVYHLRNNLGPQNNFHLSWFT